MGSIAVGSFHSGVPDEAVVGAMIRAAPHRGRRTKFIQHGSSTLAVATSEDTEDAHLAVDDDVAVALAGTIDNLAEVAREAGQAGQAPQSQDPGDILIAAYRAFGIELPSRLRGVFSSVVSDRDRVIAFRDHLGFGPVFYRRDARGVFVASEAKQIVAGAGIAEEPDLDVCEEIFFGTYDENTPSALRGVQRLPKASVLLADGSGVRLKRYWDPTERFESARYGPEEIKDRFDHLMEQAVARTLTGRDAVSLSGGIDSTAVAGYGASRHLQIEGHRLGGVSAIYPDFPAVDESEYTRSVAEHLGMPLHSYQQHARPLDRLAEWAKLADGPVPTIALPQYEEHYTYVRSLGYRRVLSGEFAEFVFDLSTYLTPYLVWHGRWGAVARLLGDRRARGAPWTSVLRSLAHPFIPTRLTAYRWARSQTDVPTWLDRDASTIDGEEPRAGAGSVGQGAAQSLLRGRHHDGSRRRLSAAVRPRVPTPVGRRRPVGVLPQPSGGGEVPRYQRQDPRPEVAPGAGPRSDPGSARQDVLRRLREGQHRLSQSAPLAQ